MDMMLRKEETHVAMRSKGAFVSGTIMKRIAVGAALAALVASLAFTQKMPGAHTAHGPVAPFGAPGDYMNPGRAAAVSHCSREESKYKQTTWGVRAITIYRACMGQHGQME
jgi:hypothetical protein